MFEQENVESRGREGERERKKEVFDMFKYAIISLWMKSVRVDGQPLTQCSQDNVVLK